MDEYRGGRLSKYADRDGSQRLLTSQYNRTFGGGIGHISENTFSLGESYNVKVRVLAETGDLVLEHVDDPNEEERSESICGKPNSFKSFLLQEPAAS